VKLVNMSVMHCFHHDHLENMSEMLDCRLEMLDLFSKKENDCIVAMFSSKIKRPYCMKV
jgi:hypothetical protein